MRTRKKFLQRADTSSLLRATRISFANNSGKEAKLYVYKRRYERIEGYSAYTVVGNANDLPWVEYEGMENCHIKDFLPAAGDFGFDMNMHILKFKLGASHGYIETHVQEHGMYFLSWEKECTALMTSGFR